MPPADDVWKSVLGAAVAYEEHRGCLAAACALLSVEAMRRLLVRRLAIVSAKSGLFWAESRQSPLSSKPIASWQNTDELEGDRQGKLYAQPCRV